MSIFYLDYENGNDSNDGSSWALAWKTLTSGATEARIAPGDVIRIAKSPDPVSIGDATWNDLSRVVTLASAQTATIELCETAWTASANVTATTSTTRKEGSYAASLNIASLFTTGKVAYKSFTELNLSSYQKISFWLRTNSAILDGVTLKVVLCSDTLGDVIVDTFYIPAVPSTSRYLPLTIAKDGGGNLGGAIQSIAIYADSDPGTITLLLDNFVACTTSGLTLQSLISKNGSAQGGTEGFYGIKSIVETTIQLDTDTNSLAGAGRGYSGITETVATYKRETIKTAMAASSTTIIQEVKDSGTSGNNIEFQCGYDIVTSIQNGETFFDGLSGYGYGIRLTSKSYIILNYFNCFRYLDGFSLIGSSNNQIITISNTNNNTGTGFSVASADNNQINTISNANNNGGSGFYIASADNNQITTINNVNNNGTDGFILVSSFNNQITTINNVNNNGSSGFRCDSTSQNASNNNQINTISNANNNGTYGIKFDSSNNNQINTLSTSGNSSGGIYNSSSTNYIRNALILEATEITGFIINENTRIYSWKHDQTADNDWVFTDGATANKQSTVTQSGNGFAWKVAITSSTRHSFYPFKLKIAEIACNANELLTVKAYVKKDHATDVGAKLVCPGGMLSGVPNNVEDVKVNDTNWEQLTLTMTPTEKGVLEIYLYSYYVSGSNNIYIDTLEVT